MKKMNNCLTCEHARKACSEGVVACSYWMKQAMDNNMSNQELLVSNLFKEPLSYAAEGWAYLTCRPDWDEKGALFRSMMTNGSLLVKKEDVCGKYEERIDLKQTRPL